MGDDDDDTSTPLTPEEIAWRSKITKAVPDMVASRVKIQPDRSAELIPVMIRRFEEASGSTAEFVGNWWVEGNPYKGVNCVFLTVRGHGAGWERCEIQFHTPESAKLADRNHRLYEIARDTNLPLRKRQKAFDKMVSRFARVPHPPGIDAIGEKVVKTRPVSTAEQHRQDRANAEKDLAEIVESLAAGTGGQVSVQAAPDLPDNLESLLELALDQSDATDYKAALKTLDRAIALYSDELEEATIRGVGIAMVNSGRVLTYLRQYDKAMNRYERAMEMCDDEYRNWASGMFVMRHHVKEAMAWTERMRGEDSAKD